MASTLQITVKDSRSQTDLARFIKSTRSPREQCIALAKFFQRAAAGLEHINFDIQTGAASTRASQTITLTYGSIAGSDTVTVAGQVLTCVTGTPSTHQFKKVTDGTATAANLAALINADSGTKLTVSATSSGAIVTVTALNPGEEGNFVTLATSNASGFALGAATLAGGLGGADTVAVNYSRGL